MMRAPDCMKGKVVHTMRLADHDTIGRLVPPSETDLDTYMSNYSTCAIVYAYTRTHTCRHTHKRTRAHTCMHITYPLPKKPEPAMVKTCCVVGALGLSDVTTGTKLATIYIS